MIAIPRFARDDSPGGNSSSQQQAAVARSRRLPAQQLRAARSQRRSSSPVARRPPPAAGFYSPVSSVGAATGFDCGDPFCRNQIVSSASTPTEKNSLCQFWNDSNQNSLVPM